MLLQTFTIDKHEVVKSTPIDYIQAAIRCIRHKGAAWIQSVVEILILSQNIS